MPVLNCFSRICVCVCMVSVRNFDDFRYARDRQHVFFFVCTLIDTQCANDFINSENVLMIYDNVLASFFLLLFLVRIFIERKMIV